MTASRYPIHTLYIPYPKFWIPYPSVTVTVTVTVTETALSETETEVDVLDVEKIIKEVEDLDESINQLHYTILVLMRIKREKEELLDTVEPYWIYKHGRKED